MSKKARKWTYALLKDVCTEIIDGTHKTPKYVSKGIRFISIANIRPYKPFNFSSYERYISEEEHDLLVKRVKPQYDDILFSRIGTLGYAKRIDIYEDISIFVGLGLARPNKSIILPKYLEYFMNTHEVYKFSVNNAKGTGRLTLPLEASRNMPIRYPSISEQARIVSHIEELFSELDKAVETLQTTKKQLAVYRQAVLKEAFIKVDKTIAVESVCIHITDGDHMPPPKSLHGIPFIMISNIEDNKINWDSTNYVGIEYYNKIGEKRTPKRGDVLYTVTGSFGIPVLVDFDKKFCFQRHIALLRPSEKILQKYLYYVMQIPDVYSQAKKMATGTAQKTVGLNMLRQIQIPYTANKKQQQEIVTQIESRLSVCDRIEKTVDAALSQAEAMRQSILKKAFNGGLL